jgi:hypothetical protein
LKSVSGQRDPPALPDLGGQPHLRHRVRAGGHALHGAGEYPGQEHRQGAGRPAAIVPLARRLTIIAFIPVYDLAIVPLARRLTRLPSGITMLQRIGAGIAVAVVTMAAAAAVEGRRLVVARERGVVDDLGATVPMRTCGGSCRSTC